jgi:hypothetical protein
MDFGSKTFGAAKNQGFMGTASNFARGMFGFGQKAVGTGRAAQAGAKTIHGLGQTAGAVQGAAGVASALMPSSPDPPPAPPPNGQTKMNSLREKTARYSFKGSSHGFGERALHLSPYAAWIGSQLLEDKYPRLSKGLNLGAYGLYAGMSAHNALKHPSERLTSGIDALSLTAMGLADLARMRRNSLNPTANSH